MEGYECRAECAAVNESEPREHVRVEVHDVALPEHEVGDQESGQDHKVV